MLDQVMIDIETLGTGNGAVILSIGAIAFDLALPSPTPPKVLYEAIDINDAVARGGKIDPETLKWWVLQDRLAMEKAFAGKTPVLTAINNLNAWIAWAAPGAMIWANPPSFDLSILRAAARRCGTDVIWSHRQERCYRTIVNTIGRNVPRVMSKMPHDPRTDANAQALHLQQIFASLSSQVPPSL